MKKLRASAGWIFVTVILVVFFVAIYGFPNFNITIPSLNAPPPLVTREVVAYSLAAEKKLAETPTIPATKLPEFTIDISDPKYQDILTGSQNEIKDKVQATLSYSGKTTDNTPNAEVSVNAEKHALIVHPKDLPNFKPGKYKLSLKLRTLEGDVNIEQDFTWGVIAVNTNKSIYKPGDIAKIGIGVLNNQGETQCKTGQDSATVWLTITDPNGSTKEYATEDDTIKDSGKCGPITVTNEPDFLSIYFINGPGIYKMKVTAEVDGEKRFIEDYFKVAEDSAFDIERTSFPTRIYPKAGYTATFTVIPKEDYNGTIEEFMPTDFKTEKISDNGKEEIVGEFKKITWNVTLKKGEAKKFTYGILFPHVSPEFYLLGPITIGDFKEARQWQIASDAINSTTGLVSYEDNNGSFTHYHIWDGDSFGAQTTMDTTPEDSRWFVEKSSPKTGEKLVVAWDESGGSRNLFVFRWNGSTWTEDLLIANAAVDSSTRLMDIAYEEESGDALFVYGDNTTQLKYRTKAAGSSSWSAEGNAGTALDSRKRWVKAKAQFNSDVILVGYLNDNERIGALLWDGVTGTFGSQFEDDDSPAQTETATSADEAFDIAWETSSGTPMIFWGSTANDIKYMAFTGGAWTAEAVATSGFTNDVAWLTASSDPISTSNNIALATQEVTTPTCRFGVWTGSSATMNGTTASCRVATAGRLITTAFENNTGKAMWVFVTSGAGTQMTWLSWTSGGGFTSATTESGATGSGIESVQLHSDLNSTSMIALYAADSGDADADPDVYYRPWDGTSWDTHTSLYGRIQGAGENAEAYGFGFDRNLETQVAYRWFASSGTVAVTSALTTQDTPYTLTTANQQFRLRLLLYYPDTLAINGRNYILQFVDPGTGTCDNPTGGTPSTWTDVGAPASGTEISYYDNTTPADADNLTENVSLDPTYGSFTRIEQDYEEGTAVSNPLYFTNSVSAMTADQVAEWDFSLVDNTTYDRNAQTFCFRVARTSGGNNLVVRIGKYPQINTAAVSDVLIQGGSLIQGGTLLQ